MKSFMNDLSLSFDTNFNSEAIIHKPFYIYYISEEVFKMGVKEKKLLLSLLLFGLVGTILLGSGITTVIAKKPSQCFEYELGSASSYTSLGDLKEGHTFVGTLAAYNSGRVLYIGISIWAKPYFAWGEKDKDGNDTIEPDELRSDGISFSVFDITYEWWVDDSRDDAVHVPSYPDGISNERIEYLFNVTIPGDAGPTVIICVNKVHVSPKEFIDPFVVPELPKAMFVTVSALLLALGVRAKDKRR